MMKLSIMVLAVIGLSGVLCGCGEKQDDPAETVKEMQSQNKPQQEMPEHLKGRGMSRGGPTAGPPKGGGQ